MFDEVLRRLAESDSFDAFAFVAAQEDTSAVLDMVNDLVRHLYNERKDVPAMLALGRAGVQLGLQQAASAANSERAAELKGKAKAIAYNLASFTWPGWNDDGIVITGTDIALGLDMAKTNLRLAQELGRPALPVSRAYWVLGAQWLASGDRAAAQAAFAQAANHAQEAQQAGEALLSEAFAALVDVLGGGDAARLDTLLTRLASVEHGAFFVDQVKTARRVFGG